MNPSMKTRPLGWDAISHISSIVAIQEGERTLLIVTLPPYPPLSRLLRTNPKLAGRSARRRMK